MPEKKSPDSGTRKKSRKYRIDEYIDNNMNFRDDVFLSMAIRSSYGVRVMQSIIDKVVKKDRNLICETLGKPSNKAFI